MTSSLTEIKHLNIENMPPKGANVFKWIWFFISPYGNVLYPYFVYRVVRYTTLSLFPVFLGFMLDGYVSNKISANPSLYTYSSIIYLIFYSFFLITPFLFKLEAVAAENSSRSLALLGMKILNSMPISWHIDQATGRKMELVGDARKGIFELLILFRWQMVPVIGSLISSLIMVLIFDGPLYYSLTMCLFAATYLFSAWYFGLALSRLYVVFKDTNAKLLSRLYEFSSAALTVKSLSLEKYLEEQAFITEGNARDAARKIYDANFRKWTIVNFLTLLFLLFFSVYGFKDLSTGVLSAGSYSSLLMLFMYLWLGLEDISVSQDKIYDYLTAIKRFANLCDVSRDLAKEEIKVGASVPADDWHKLEVKDLSFSYKEQADQAISNMSFTLERGKKIAIVGQSGAGKTTLIKLLLRLYRPDAGEIQLEGVDISSFDHALWLTYLAYVPQEIELFDGTIRENILLGRKDISEEKYIEAIKGSGVENFTQGLADKDLAVIGERGLKLSGGQRQRIGIARALLRNANILLLDEATSALDSLTEKHIQDTLFNDLKGVTVIIIAHRLSTIKRADHILVLDQGQLVEEGTFANLKDSGGKFTEMWEGARI